MILTQMQEVNPNTNETFMLHFYRYKTKTLNVVRYFDRIS